MANKLKENKHENLLISSAKNIVELEIDIRENPSPFIFIDSVNTYNLNVNQIEKLREDYPKISFILIYQSTKNGALRGSNEILHNSDILVRVENGMAETEKNRYNELSKVTIFA
jgi:predicted ATP-dependent serine protease